MRTAQMGELGARELANIAHAAVVSDPSERLCALFANFARAAERRMSEFKA